MERIATKKQKNKNKKTEIKNITTLSKNNRLNMLK